MTSLAYTKTLVAGTPENVNDVQTMFNDAKTFLNGANLDGTNIASGYVEPAFSSYKTERLREGFAQGPSMTSSGVWVLQPSGAPVLSSTSSAIGGAFYFDPAWYTAGSRATKLRVFAVYITNGTQSGQTSTVGFYPVSSVSGGATTLGTVTSGSTVAFANPAINTLGQSNSGDFTAPAAGHYVLAFNTGGAWAAGANAQVDVLLQVRQV